MACRACSSGSGLSSYYNELSLERKEPIDEKQQISTLQQRIDHLESSQTEMTRIVNAVIANQAALMIQYANRIKQLNDTAIQNNGLSFTAGFGLSSCFYAVFHNWDIISKWFGRG